MKAKLSESSASRIERIVQEGLDDLYDKKRKPLCASVNCLKRTHKKTKFCVNHQNAGWKPFNVNSERYEKSY
jgi:hypothetical protein